MEALRRIPEANVVACADLDADRAAEAAARFAGAASYTNLDQMLDRHQLDGVFVCVPPYAHGRIELTLVERGVHFLVEKPLSNERSIPLRVLEALQGKALITSVGYVLRYRDNVQRMKDWVSQDPPVLARGRYLSSVPPSPWWRRKEKSGGQIMEQSTHVFDLARCVFGEVKSVYCAALRGRVTEVEDYNVEDASLCTLVFQSGLLCEISSTCALTPGLPSHLAWDLSLEAVGRRGRARLEGVEMKLTQWSPQETREYLSAADAFLLEDQAFVQALAGGDASRIQSPYADAVKTQLVTCAANESMETGAPVHL
jgi:predicted dehydrogenase